MFHNQFMIITSKADRKLDFIVFLAIFTCMWYLCHLDIVSKYKGITQVPEYFTICDTIDQNILSYTLEQIEFNCADIYGQTPSIFSIHISIDYKIYR